MPKKNTRLNNDDPIRIQANLMLDSGESIKDVLDFVNSQEIPEHYGDEPGAKWLYHSNTIRQWRDKLNKEVQKIINNQKLIGLKNYLKN